MNALLSTGANASGPSAQEEYAAGRETYRRSRIKIICAVVIAICFWFAVPYSFPLRLEQDPARAAVSEAAAYEGNLSRQIALPVVLLVSMCALYRLPRVGRFFKASQLSLACVAYVAWALASISWSSDPGMTGKRLLVFAIDGTFAVVLARCASVDEIALFGALSTGLVALIALFADVFVLRAFAPLDPDYRFMGVMTANYQAMNLFVCLICCLTLAQRSARHLRLFAPWLVLFAALLFLTRARVGTFLCVSASIFVTVRLARMWLQPQGRAVALVAALTVLLPCVTFAIVRSGQSALSSVLMMGRSDTENTASLSNRAPLWAELLDSVQEHPVLGFGFEAFWTPERVQKISTDQGWVVPHAHNTYLDQVLSLGFVGCLLYLCMLVGACIVAWRRYGRGQSERSLFSALMLTWLVSLGMTESVPVAPYLPGLIAYSCIVKMCMTEEESPRGDDEIAKYARSLRRSGWAPDEEFLKLGTAGGPR